MLFEHAPRLFYSVFGLSLVIALLGLIPTFYEGTPEWVLFGVLILATGLPHGATDHTLHAFTCRQKGLPVKWLPFFAHYLTAIVLFSASWIWLPIFSLVVFLMVSAYHFGQSQFLYLKLPEYHPFKVALYFAWGGALLLGLLWFHHEAAKTILQPVLGADHWLWKAFVANGQTIVAGLWGLVLLGWGVALKEKWMRPQAAGAELLVATLLFLLIQLTPLIVAFSVYFGLWHALSSMTEEIQRLQQEEPRFGFAAFYRHAWPFTLLSIVGIGLLVGASVYFKQQVSPYLLFFIAISALTMPHIVAIGRFYTLPRKLSITRE